MSDVFTHAGPLGYLVLLGAVLGLVASAGAGALAVTRRRVPLALLLVVPYGLLAIGAAGATLATTGVLADVAAAEPNRIPLVAMGGAWNAMMVDWLARWAAAFVLVAATWAAAVGSALATGDEPRFTPVAAAGAALTSGIGALIILVMAFRSGLGGGAYLLALLVLAGGLGVAFAATRRSTDEDMFRVAGMRYAASVAMLLGTYHAMRAADIGNRIDVFAADGELLNTTDLLKAIDLFTKTVDPGMTIGMVALFVAVLVAFFGFFAEIGEVVVRYTVFDMFAVVALLVGVGFLRVLENLGFSSVYVVATNSPAVEMYEEMGGELPSAVVTREDVAQVVRLADGGFGDVIAMHIGEWTRMYRWTGTRWRSDERKLDDVEVNQERPALIAVDRSANAEEIIPLIEKAGGQAYLLLRASEVAPDKTVPAEVARLQTTFLPVKLATERDLKTELWTQAGSPEVNWGPTTWYGPGDDALDTVTYAAAALVDTKATGVNLVVKGRKVGDVVTSCVPYLIETEEGIEAMVADIRARAAAGPAGDGEAAPAEGGGDAAGAAEGEDEGAAEGEDEAESDEPAELVMNSSRWCAITGDDPETLRTEAAGLWEIPRPTNVSMSIGTQGPIADAAEVNDKLRRELGGLSYCAEQEAKEQAAKGGEPLRGRMALQLALSKDGRVYDTLVDEKSPVQSPAMLRCASKRFRKLQFKLVEPPAPPEGEEAPPPPEPETPPRVLVDLDFR